MRELLDAGPARRRCDDGDRADDGRGARAGVTRSAEPRTPVLRTVADPVKSTGGYAVLWGNLAPDGAVIKVANQAGNRHRGPAKVFHGEQDAFRAVSDGRIQAGDVVVAPLRGAEGRAGDAGDDPPHRRHRRRRASSTASALLTDGRFGGGTQGIVRRPHLARGGRRAAPRDPPRRRRRRDRRRGEPTPRRALATTRSPPASRPSSIRRRATRPASSRSTRASSARPRRAPASVPERGDDRGSPAASTRSRPSRGSTSGSGS